jgi:hypothetical protein
VRPVIVPTPEQRALARKLLGRPDYTGPHRVYFIQGEGGGPIKIGHATYVKSRLKELQSGSPVKLVVLATTPGREREERALHDRFASHRLHGEWFSPAPELLEYIRGIAG